MKKYTETQIKKREKNPYTFKVTDYKIYFAVKFKEDFGTPVCCILTSVEKTAQMSEVSEMERRPQNESEIFKSD